MNSKNQKLNSFEKELSVSIEDIEILLHGFEPIPWLDFYLNPRRLRGSDFLMRWSQGLWSEERLTEGINSTDQFFAIAYGTSSTAPEDDIRKYELYFELLDVAGHGDIKRPDLLIFQSKHFNEVQTIISEIEKKYKIPFILNDEDNDNDFLEGEQIFPFISEDDELIQSLLSLAIIATECENSLWKAQDMPNYGEALRPMRRLGGKPGLPKATIVPTVRIKEEDRKRLMIWETNNKVPIHIWHVFFDLAFGLSLKEANRLIDEGLIDPTINTFQAPGGSTTKKAIYKFYYHYAYPLAHSTEEPSVEAKYIIDKNGHILPYVTFKGGSLDIDDTTIQVLTRIAEGK
jgi:hypothetical protein